MKLGFHRENVKRSLAFALAVWLSGAAFLFCCEMPTQAAAAAQSSENAETCPLTEKRHCDKQTAAAGETSPESAVWQTERRGAECCRMMTAVFDKARKLEQNSRSVAALSVVEIASPQISRVETSSDAPSIYRPPVLNRGGTYLKNRVLRI